jgi:hypothetical protein
MQHAVNCGLENWGGSQPGVCEKRYNFLLILIEIGLEWS